MSAEAILSITVVSLLVALVMTIRSNQKTVANLLDRLLEANHLEPLKPREEEEAQAIPEEPVRRLSFRIPGVPVPPLR